LIPVGHFANHRGAGSNERIIRVKGRLTQKGHLGAVPRKDLQINQSMKGKIKQNKTKQQSHCEPQLK
jgi:hypothetical protein